MPKIHLYLSEDTAELVGYGSAGEVTIRNGHKRVGTKFADIWSHIHPFYYDVRPDAICAAGLLAPHPDDCASRHIPTAFLMSDREWFEFYDWILKLDPSGEQRIIWKGEVNKGVIVARFLEGLLADFYEPQRHLLQYRAKREKSRVKRPQLSYDAAQEKRRAERTLREEQFNAIEPKSRE